MPRGPRLDAPGALHHAMARGIDRQTIFHDDVDRDDLVSRLALLAGEARCTFYAWALMPNHFHLLLRTTATPLERTMRSLLTGFAVSFNRRHQRVGHLLQNRYKSILCEDEAYFLELVRYIHLNPIRAGLVATLPELDRYPYTGHAALLGHVNRSWQATHAVLEQFSSDAATARSAYHEFVASGIDGGANGNVSGVGLVRANGGWEVRGEPRKPREAFGPDERVLGREDFVRRLGREIEEQVGEKRAPLDLDRLIERVCAFTGTSREALGASGRSDSVCRAREGVAFLWIDCLGGSGRRLALKLGLAPMSVYDAAKRGRRFARKWRRLLAV